MTRVLTIRIRPDLLSKAEAKAARQGLDRASYIRGLIEQDLASPDKNEQHRFASEDLIGCYVSETPGQAATNARVREVMRRRHLDRRESNR